MQLKIGESSKQQRYSQRTGSPTPTEQQDRYSMPVQTRDILNSPKSGRQNSMFQATNDTQFPSPEKSPFKKSNANKSGRNINQSERSIKNSKTNDRYGNEYIEIKNDNKEKRNREIQSPFAQTLLNGNMRELNGENIYKSEDMLPNLASTDFQKFKNQKP